MEFFPKILHLGLKYAALFSREKNKQTKQKTPIFCYQNCRIIIFKELGHESGVWADLHFMPSLQPRFHARLIM